MPTATLTSKGQITIPKEVREKLQLRTGHRLAFVFDPSGKVTLEPLNKDYRRLHGIVKHTNTRPVTLAEMDEAIAEGAAGL
jgi:AbrB family looped-hinge helix DNA binding protein